jgi:hypothetical protein
MPKKLKPATIKRQLREIARLSTELCGGEKQALKWLKTKQSYFWNEVPFAMILAGEGRYVLDFLRERAGKK